MVYWSLQLSMICLCHLWSYKKLTNEWKIVSVCLSPCLHICLPRPSFMASQAALGEGLDFHWRVEVKTSTFRRLQGLSVVSSGLAQAPCSIIDYVSTISCRGYFNHAFYSCKIPREPLLKSFALHWDSYVPLLLAHQWLSINMALMEPVTDCFQCLIFQCLVSGLGSHYLTKRNHIPLCEKAWP